MKISLCMPYFNRREHLYGSLTAYRDLYSHLDLEVVICDDGSIPPLEDISKYVLPDIKVIRLEQKDIALNPCVPINAAIRASTGDVIVLTNPEVMHTENVLDGMLETLQSEKDYVTVACYDPMLGWLAGPETDYSSGGRLPIPRSSHFHFCAMFTRALFDEVGGFDETFRFGQGCDDSDWLWKVYVAGANFKLAPGIVMHARGERTQWYGTVEQNADLLIDKWKHLPEFIWSDAAHAGRMRLGWKGGVAAGTACGSGSTPENTRCVQFRLPWLLCQHGIKSVADAGAGDTNWARQACAAIEYRAYDLVPRADGVVGWDISKKALPPVDAILCRHVLIHLDPPRLARTLELFKQSAKYLIASHYPESNNAFDPTQYFHRTNLTPLLGEPVDMIRDTADEGCYLAIWRL